MDETVDGGLMEGGRREMRDDLSLFGSVSCSVRDKHQNSKLDGKGKVTTTATSTTSYCTPKFTHDLLSDIRNNSIGVMRYSDVIN
jgi:hypothetical protein